LGARSSLIQPGSWSSGVIPPTQRCYVAVPSILEDQLCDPVVETR
jgi:hypothetical protein